MRTLFIAAASALFFAAVVTELSMRLWPGEYFPLLLLVFVVLVLSGLLNLKLAGWLVPAGNGGAAKTSRQPADRAGRGASTSERASKRGGARKDTKRDRNGDGRSQAEHRPPPSDAPRETGTVKWFNRNKGFGFVIRESGEEIFVHQRSIRQTGEGDDRRRPTLKDGQSVTFVVAEREKGLQAEDVVPAE